MNRYFIRIVAVLLAPCFLADTGQAFVAPAITIAPTKSADPSIQSQALSLHFISSVGVENLRRITVFRRLGRIYRRFEQSPFAWALLAAGGMIMGFDVPPTDGECALKDATELVVGKTPYRLRIIGGMRDFPLFYATQGGIAVAESAMDTPGLAMLTMQERNRPLIDDAIAGMRRIYGLATSSAKKHTQQILSLLADLRIEQLTRAIETSLHPGPEKTALLQVKADISHAGIVTLATGMETLVSYFNSPDATGGNLLKQINQALADPARGPGAPSPQGPLQNLAAVREVRIRYLYQWDTTLVICVEVDVVDGRRVQFLVNIPKDVTLSGSRTLQTERVLAEDFELNPYHVIRSHGIVQAPSPSGFTHGHIPLQFGEWLAKPYNVDTRVVDGALLWELRAPDGTVITLSGREADPLISQTNVADALYSRIQPDGVLRTLFLGESKDLVAIRDSATGWRFILVWNQGRSRDDYSTIVTNALFRTVIARHGNGFALAWVGKPDAALRDVREGLLQQLRSSKAAGTLSEEQEWGRQADAALETLTKIAYEQAFPKFTANPGTAILLESAKNIPTHVLRDKIASTRLVVQHFLADALRHHIENTFRSFDWLTQELLVAVLAKCGTSDAAAIEEALPDDVYLTPNAAARLAAAVNSFGSMENLKPFYEAGKRGMNPTAGKELPRKKGEARTYRLTSPEDLESLGLSLQVIHRLKAYLESEPWSIYLREIRRAVNPLHEDKVAGYFASSADASSLMSATDAGTMHLYEMKLYEQQTAGRAGNPAQEIEMYIHLKQMPKLFSRAGGWNTALPPGCDLKRYLFLELFASGVEEITEESLDADHRTAQLSYWWSPPGAAARARRMIIHSGIDITKPIEGLPAFDIFAEKANEVADSENDWPLLKAHILKHQLKPGGFAIGSATMSDGKVVTIMDSELQVFFKRIALSEAIVLLQGSLADFAEGFRARAGWGYGPVEIWVKNSDSPDLEGLLSRMERLLGIRQPQEILSRNETESWEAVAVFLLQLKLLNFLDVLIPGAAVFNFGGGADWTASIFGSGLYNVDNRLVSAEPEPLFHKLWALLKERLPEFMAALPDIDGIGHVVHEKDDIWAPDFIERWANRMHAGDIVLLKHLQDFIYDGNLSDSDNIGRLQRWVFRFANALPAGVFMALVEPLPLCAWDGLPVGRRTLTELFLETGLFRDHLGTLLTLWNPQYEERLAQINQNNMARGILGLTEPHVGNAVAFRSGGALQLIVKLNQAA